MTHHHLDKLYQQTILEHNKNPRCFGEIADPTHRCHGRNPLCGDDYHLSLRVEDGIVAAIGYIGDGCAISKSSASMMSSAFVGKSVEVCQEMVSKFLDLLTSDHPDSSARAALKGLALFESVKKYPVRVKCATLIWRAFSAALEKGEQISTE